jgi:cyclic beta-1,2-glucan synthetase
VLQDQIMGLISAGIEASVIDRPGGIFVRSAEQISSEDRMLLQSVARAVITDDGGTLAEQLDIASPRRAAPATAIQADAVPAHVPDRWHPRAGADRFRICCSTVWAASPRRARVRHHHGARPGDAGAVGQRAGQSALRHRRLGERLGYTWSENAHEFRLTPWHNDPVSDPSGEAFYLRDEESGHVWSPTPLPARGTGPM